MIDLLRMPQQNLQMLFNGPGYPQNCAIPWRSQLHLTHGSLARPELGDGTRRWRGAFIPWMNWVILSKLYILVHSEWH